jgi:adenosine kinase
MEIIVSGSIAYDYLMRFPGRFADHFIADHMHQVTLSFLVDEMTKHWGGVAANIAYSLALLGMRPKLMGTAGRDFPDYRQWLERAGVDTSTVRQHDDVFTASFFANTDMENNQISSFYAGAMAYSDNYTIAEAYAGVPDMVVISPNTPKAMDILADECRERGLRFIYDPSQQVSRLSGEELNRQMQGAQMMICNAYESEVICKKTEKTLHDLRASFEYLVITQGKRGSHIYHHGELHEVPSFPEVKIKDPTGVGDAYRAGLIRGLAAGLPIRTTGLVGGLCATYVLEQVGTQSHYYTMPEFIARFRAHFDDEGALDSLMSASATTQS